MDCFSSNLEDEIEYAYGDCDAHSCEISEIYCYSEDFHINFKSYMNICSSLSITKFWKKLDSSQKKAFIEHLLQLIEVNDIDKRLSGLRAILFLVQGVFTECSSLAEQEITAKDNVFLLYESGVFPDLIQLLVMEIEASFLDKTERTADRIILNILCTMTEVMRYKKDDDTPREKALRERFREELSNPLVTTDELLPITLFQMIAVFSSGNNSYFPIKKILLLLWKSLLVILGGIDELRKLKNYYRSRVGLPNVPDDTFEVIKNMRPTRLHILDKFDQPRFMKRQRLIRSKQRAFLSDETSSLGEVEVETTETEVSVEDIRDEESLEVFAVREGESDFIYLKKDLLSLIPPLPDLKRVEMENDPNRGLPWVPKVRNNDIDAFLHQTRMKFLGYSLPYNRTATAGLPGPILESLKTLEKHLYVSLSEVQIEREEQISKYPLTFGELDPESLLSPAESLYKAMLPNLSKYLISLLKILLAASPTTKAKTESLNIHSEVPYSSEQKVPMLREADINRNKEIIVKAISGILLLMLKHYKINHIYQFEYISQQLMGANCIPLILKFFNHDICFYISSKPSIIHEFPRCVTTQKDQEESNYEPTCCKRNMFSCISLARILNKLTKWKSSRIMLLIVFKAAPILKRLLRAKHAMFQLYVLKLLKMQARFLGRQWRKSNMVILSAIYHKVRHRLTDDWAFANELDTKPWDYQKNEITLQSNIKLFHFRRYERYSKSFESVLMFLDKQPCSKENSSNNNTNNLNNNSVINNESAEYLEEGFKIPSSYFAQKLFKPLENNYLKLLRKDFVFTKGFKENYLEWLEREVFQYNIDWDQLLKETDTSDI